MTKIEPNEIPLELDDLLLLEPKPNKKKKKKKKKKYNEHNKKHKKHKNKKKKNKKCDVSHSYIYKNRVKKNVLQRLTDSLHIDMKSKINVTVNDDTINNAITTGLTLFKYFIDKKFK